MALTSYISIYDRSIRELLYEKFGDSMNIDEYSSDDNVNINKGVVQIPKPTAQRFVAEKRNETNLDFINYWKTNLEFDWKRNQTPLGRTGMNISQEGPPRTAANIKSYPVNLGYDVWFWSKSLDRINQTLEIYLKWVQNNPNISLLVNDTYPLEPDLHFGQIIDESQVDLMYEQGLYFVYRVSINMDAWIFDITDTGPDSDGNNEIYKVILTMYDQDTLTEEQRVDMMTDADPELEARLRFFRKEFDLVNDTETITG